MIDTTSTPTTAASPGPAAGLSHIHRFVLGDGARPLLLLHGTGGDEADLIPLGAAIAPGAALLSPRGQVKEGTANRFFRRLGEGRFDIPDLHARTEALAGFVAAARQAYGLGAPVAVGFSNGANIAASLLLTRPETLAGAILIRAMVPFEPDRRVDLGGRPVLLLSGVADPLVPAADARRLAAMLAEAGADVTHLDVAAGHGLAPRDVREAEAWWRRTMPAA